VQEFEQLDESLDQALNESLDENRESKMKTETNTGAVMYVTQSRYFSPVFNAAIFDGPIRIYLAQFQEAQALKLYYNLQERFSEVRKQARGLFKERGQNIFVMMYPNEETFDLSFSGESARSSKPMGAGAEVCSSFGAEIIRARLGTDYVVGVSGPIEDEDLENLCREIDQIVSTPAAI
jgi:hypothetical protein